MIRLIFFNLLLFACCGYALWKGTRDARIIGATCLVASLASYPFLSNYAGIEISVLLVDLIVLGLFVFVALRSDRFWPLWMAGLHLTTIIGHVLRMMSSDVVPLAYAVALRMWAYPELIILAVAVWRGEQRRRAESADWSTA